MEETRYPIGRFAFDAAISAEKGREMINRIAALPEELARSVAGLSAERLDTPYREGGWTPRQIVHHLADSHMNAFIRFKLALTEDNPQIKPYSQEAWAALSDVQGADAELSLKILEGLHGRFAALLASLKTEDFARTFLHPENGVMTLDRTLQIYAWHCRHHVAHITSLRGRKGW